MASGVELAVAYVSLSVESSDVAGGVRKQLGIVEKDAAKTGRRAGSNLGGQLTSFVGKSMRRLAGGGIAAAGAAAGAAFFKGFGRLKAIEEAQAKLRGLGHDTKTIETVMKSALNAVKGTAYGLGDAATAAAGAIASGIKPGQELENHLKLVGDAATIAGIGFDEMAAIFGKVSASGVLQGEEIAQLSDRGIPILQLLSKQLGVSAQDVKKLASEGKVSFADFSAAMKEGMGGAALESGKTMQGAFNNMIASLGRIGANLLEPFYKLLPGAFGAVTAALGPVEAGAKRVSEGIMSGFQSAADAVTGALTPALAGLGGAVGPNVTLMDRLRAAFDAVAASPFGVWVQSIVTAFSAKLQPAMAEISNLVTTRLLPAFVDIGNVVGPVLVDVARAFGDLVAAIVGSPLFGFLASVAKQLITGFLGGIVDAVTGVVKVVTGVFDTLAGILTGDWSRVWEGIKTVASGAVQALWGVLNVWLVGRVVSLIRGVGASIARLFGGNLAAIFSRFAAMARGVFETVALRAMYMWDAVRAVFAPLAGWLGRLAPIFGLMAAGVAAAWGKIVDAARAAWSAISGVFSGVASSAQSTGASIGGFFSAFAATVSGAWAAVTGAVSSAWSFISGIFGQIVSFVGGVLSSVWHVFSVIVQNAWELVSVSAYNAWQIVKGIFLALADWLGPKISAAFAVYRAAATTAWNAVSAVVTAVWGVIRDRVFTPIQTWLGILGAGLRLFATVAATTWNTVRNAITAVWGFLLGSVFTPIRTWLTATFTAAFSAFRNIATVVWNTVRNVISTVWDFILNRVFNPLRQWITNILVTAFNFYLGIAQRVWAAIQAAISTAWNFILTRVFTPLRNWVVNTLVAGFNTFRTAATNAWNRMRDALRAGWDWINTRVFTPFKNGLNSLWSWFGTVVDGIKKTWDTLKEKVAAPIRYVINTVIRDNLVRAWNAVASKVNLKQFDFKGFDRGGWTGPGSKMQPAGFVHADEFVVRKKSRRKFERDQPGLLDHINRTGSLNGYADGGRVIPGYAGGGLAKPWPSYVAALARRLFPGIRSIGGYGNRQGKSDHPAGYALDFMVPTDSSVGDAIAAWGMKHFQSMALKYIIWKQRINSGSGWRGMADRGSITANHRDHPHFSFIHGRAGNPAAIGPQLSPEEVAAALAGGAGGFSIPNPAYKAAMALINLPINAAKGLIGAIAGRFGASDWTDIAKGAATMPLDWVQQFLTGKVDELIPKTLFSGVAAAGEAAASAAVGGVKGIVKGAAAARGWATGKAWDALQWVIGRESSWNPRAQNPSSTAFGLFQFLNCVTLDAVILTRRGWLAHDEVRVGDETIGYNPDTGRSEWTTIRHVVHKPAQDVVRIGNSRWQATVTPGHRWWTLRRGLVLVDEEFETCPECGATGTKRGPFTSPRSLRVHRAKAHGVDSRPAEYIDYAGFTTTDALTKAHTLVLSAHADTGAGLPITRDEARLLGWLAGDGTVRFPSDDAVHLQLWQAKPHRLPEIREMLTGIPHSEYVRDRGPGNHHPEYSWYLHAEYAHDLAARSGLRGGFEAMVLAMSPTQRLEWLSGMVAAEGTPVPSGPDGEVMRIPQNDGDVAEATMLAAYLSGFRPSRRTRSNQPGFSMITLARPEVHAAALTTTPVDDAEVWCVQTDLGTWTMRQGEHISLTGNSTWGTVGASKSSDPAVQARAGMAYIAQRYGSPQAAQAFWRRNGYYAEGGRVTEGAQLFDRGGFLMPGTTIVQNNTGRPETVRTYEQEKALLSGAGGANITINGIKHDSVDEFAGALNYAMIRARNVGRYAGVR